MTAIIRQDFKTDSWHVYDTSFSDNGMIFKTELEALEHAKNAGYTFANVPSCSSISISIDQLIMSRKTTMKNSTQ